jgi:hypothetical protein
MALCMLVFVAQIRLECQTQSRTSRQHGFRKQETANELLNREEIGNGQISAQ